MNQSVKLLSPPVLVDSTRFNLYAMTKVSRKPKHTHTLNLDFKTYTFCARFSPDHPPGKKESEHAWIGNGFLFWTWLSTAFSGMSKIWDGLLLCILLSTRPVDRALCAVDSPVNCHTFCLICFFFQVFFLFQLQLDLFDHHLHLPTNNGWTIGDQPIQNRSRL